MTNLPTPRLAIEVFDNDPANFGPATLRCLIPNAAKVGWSWYSRFPANSFWSLSQVNPINQMIVPGLSHVRIWYMNDATGYGPVLVFNGRVGDPDMSGDDVIWTAWSYLAELAISRTGYNVYYKNKTIGTVVDQEWRRDDATPVKFAKYGAKVRDHSLLAHVKTGSIEDPLNVAGDHAIKTDSQFGVIDMSRLLVMFDMSEIGRANTDNNVTFEISRSIDPHFNFWKNKGTAQLGRKLVFPGTVRDFRYVPGVLNIRNDLATIGTKKGQATEIKADQASGPYGTDLFGRRQDTFPIKTLFGYPNIDDETTGKYQAQVKVTQAAVKEASRLTQAVRLDVRPELLEPFDGWDMEDTLPVEIDHGDTQLRAMYRMVGARGVLDDTGYHASYFLQLPST